MVDIIMDNLVSILIPCFQQGRFLREAVESALAQTHRPLEIIIINDGSTDNTGEIARAYAAQRPEMVRFIEQTNQGQAKARQAGLDAAGGQFLVMLDADDLLEPWMIEQCLKTYARHPVADAVTGDVWLVDESGQTKIRLWEQNWTPGWPDILSNNPYGALAGIMARTSSVKAAGGLKVEGTPGAEDWDLWSRMARCGMLFVPLRQQAARYRQSSASYSGNALKMLRATLELLERASQPDPRLESFTRETGGTPLPPIAEDLHQHLRNGKVFKSLGLAVCRSGAPEELPDKLPEELDQIAAHLTPGRFSVRYCSDQFLEGIHLGFFQKNENALNARLPAGKIMEIVERRMGERKLERHDQAIRRELARTMERPLRKRSLLARLRERLYKAIS